MEADKFSSIAGRYDLANSVLSFGRHRRWKKRLVEAAGIQSGERILDLCSERAMSPFWRQKMGDGGSDGR